MWSPSFTPAASHCARHTFLRGASAQVINAAGSCDKRRGPYCNSAWPRQNLIARSGSQATGRSRGRALDDRMMTENLVFLQALLAHEDRLEALLGPNWPSFQVGLLDLLEAVRKAEDDVAMLRAVDDVMAWCLDGPTTELTRELM